MVSMKFQNISCNTSVAKSEIEDIAAKHLESVSVKLPTVSFSRDIIEEDGSDTRLGYLTSYWKTARVLPRCPTIG